MDYLCLYSNFWQWGNQRHLRSELNAVWLYQQDAELLQEDINAIQTWASTWQINFNVSKCCSIHFTQAITYKMENTYYLYDTPLLSLDHFKYLGITLQSNLRYDRHIQEITAKANHTLGLLRRNVRTSSPQLKERAYKALVRPQLIRFHRMVPLAKIPCGWCQESSTPLRPLHLYWLLFWLQRVHYDQKPSLGFLSNSTN